MGGLVVPNARRAELLFLTEFLLLAGHFPAPSTVEDYLLEVCNVSLHPVDDGTNLAIS
jgi:hypothetical protein